MVLSLLLTFPTLAQKNSAEIVQNYGEYLVLGTLKDGDTTHPGQSSSAIQQGAGYSGLLLDTPMDIRPLLSPQTLKNYPALQRGFLEHIQIDLTNEQRKFYKSHYGEQVRIRCNIDFVGRFYTPVYCEALEINSI